MDIQGIEKINEAALVAIGNNERYEAQFLFRKNAKQSPCFITLNNLGVFYVFEGLFKSNNSRRRATKLGVGYLEKAETHQKSSLTLLALGWVHFQSQRYSEASECFRQAYELKSSYDTAYNMAVSLYMLGAYSQAAVWYEKAFGSCDASNQKEIYVEYAFSLPHCDRKKCVKALYHMLEDDTSSIEIDIFTLAYFCDDLLMAEEQIQHLFKHFSPDIQDMALVIDCLLKLNKKVDAMEYLKCKVEELEESDYNMKLQINQLKKIFSNADYRATIISKYKRCVPLANQCCYYGCKQHNRL